MKWSAPPEVADLHAEVDGWTRRHAWIIGRQGGCFEAIYTKAAETRKISLPENVARNAEAGLWAIKRGLKPRPSWPGLRARRSRKNGTGGEPFSGHAVPVENRVTDADLVPVKDQVGTSAADASRETTAADLDGAR
jgi:hypothetical protein